MSANPLAAPQAEHFWQTQEQLLDFAEELYPQLV